MASGDAEVVVLGVDPTDRRSIAELSRSVPAGAATLFQPQPTCWRPGWTGAWTRNPPAALAVALQARLLDVAAPSAVEEAVESAAAERDLDLRSLSTGRTAAGGGTRRAWTAGAWAVTASALAAPVAAASLVAIGGLLHVLLAVLLLLAVGGLGLGFVLAHEAARIQRTDAAIAAALRVALADADADGDSGPGTAVLVVPARHARGVAAALRAADVPASSQQVGPVA